MKTLVQLLGAAFALLALSSCLESDTVISVKKDGSGTITETIVIGAQMVAMMQMGGGQEGAEDPFSDYNEENLKKKAATFGEGTEFVSVDRVEKDGKITFTSKYKIADINHFVFSASSVMGGADEEADASEQATFSMEGDVLTISVPDPSGEDLNFGDEEMGEEEMAMAAPMLAGMRMSAKLELADEIKESNATYQEGNSITLFSMNFDELMKNEGGFAAMKKLGAETREEVAKAVTEVQGVEMETKEKVTITFK